MPLTLLGLAGLLVGCASQQPAKPESSAAAPRGEGEGGGRWEAVFLPPDTDDVVLFTGAEDPWFGRRDGELAIRSDGPLLASDQWPEPDRPDLRYWRIVPQPTQAQNYQYFSSTPYEYYGGYWRGYRRWR